MQNELSAKFKENASNADFSADSIRKFAAGMLADSIRNNPSPEHLENKIRFIIDMIAEESRSDAFFTAVHLVHALAENNFPQQSDILYAVHEKIFSLSDNAIYDGHLRKIVSQLIHADAVIARSLNISRDWAPQAVKLINQCAKDGQDGIYEAYHVAMEFIRNKPEWNEVDPDIQNYDDPYKYALVTRVGHHEGTMDLIRSIINGNSPDQYNGVKKLISSILDSDSAVSSPTGPIPSP